MSVSSWEKREKSRERSKAKKKRSQDKRWDEGTKRMTTDRTEHANELRVFLSYSLVETRDLGKSLKIPPELAIVTLNTIKSRPLIRQFPQGCWPLICRGRPGCGVNVRVNCRRHNVILHNMPAAGGALAGDGSWSLRGSDPVKSSEKSDSSRRASMSGESRSVKQSKYRSLQGLFQPD